MTGKDGKGISGWVAIWIFVILSVCIALVGYTALDIYKERLREHIQKDLLSLTKLKIEQIVAWQNERIRDALDVQNKIFLALRTQAYLDDRTSEIKRNVLSAQLTHIKETQNFTRVTLTDRDGAVVLSSHQGSTVGYGSIDTTLQPVLAAAITSKNIALSDLYLDAHNVVRMSAVIPLFERDPVTGETAGDVIGTIIAHIAPSKLFSLIQHWPLDSNTAETLLIRREGSDVVFLNELRYKKDTALVFRLPIDRDRQLPAAMAALGQQGIVEGYDYRGHLVLAAVMPVSDTQWFIVSKVDQDEIYQPIAAFAKVAAIIVALLMALSMGIAMIWQKRNVVFRQRQYEINERFRKVFDNAPIGIALSGKDYRFIDVNRQLCEMLEYSADELKGMTFKDITHPDDLNQSVDIVRKMINNEIHSFRIEKRHVTKSGKVLWDNTISSMIRDDKGQWLYNIVMIEDVTLRKEMEASLIRVNRLYAVLSQINQSIVRIKDETTLFDEICRTCLEHGGFSMAWIGLIDRETLFVEPVAFAGIDERELNNIVLSAVNRPNVVCPTTTAIRDARPSICNDITTDPIMAAWRDDALQRGYLSVAAFPIMMRGDVVGTLSLGVSQKGFFLESEIRLLEEVLADISFALDTMEGERARAAFEKAIEKQARRNKMILDISMDGFVLVDNAGHIREVNLTFANLLGYSPEELCNMSIMAIDIGQNEQEVLERINEVLQTGHSRFETVLRHRDGKRVNVEVSTAFIELDGEIMLFGFNSDITEKKHRDKIFLLRERQAQMGEMLSIIAHQWRQPISAIAASVNRLELEAMFDTLDKAVLNDSLERIKLQIQHMSQTITDFSTFFQPDKDMEVSAISTVIHKAIGIIEQQLKNKGIELNLNCQTETPVRTYVNELVQVFLSIIENAVDALHGREIANPRISIDIRERDTDVIAEITDNAGGISPEIMDNIFFPYYSTKEAVQGTGLGLYMARMIVEQHCHGKLSAVNIEDGARFIIEIPKKDE
ncbi:MAG: PAS domain S-box protein [Candidatus Magnetobacterium sp. LHC-1]|nr:PAS domain S-box protein [Nitrospirota bacterium]